MDASTGSPHIWGLGFTPNRTSRLDWPAFRRWDRQSFTLRPRWWMKQDLNLRTRSFRHGAESAQLLHPCISSLLIIANT